jgi:hypothetical protein
MRPIMPEAAATTHRPGAWAVEMFEAKNVACEDSFSTIRRPMVVPWAKKRRKHGPQATSCSPNDF